MKTCDALSFGVPLTPDPHPSIPVSAGDCVLANEKSYCYEFGECKSDNICQNNVLPNYLVSAGIVDLPNDIAYLCSDSKCRFSTPTTACFTTLKSNLSSCARNLFNLWHTMYTQVSFSIIRAVHVTFPTETATDGFFLRQSGEGST